MSLQTCVHGVAPSQIEPATGLGMCGGVSAAGSLGNDDVEIGVRGRRQREGCVMVNRQLLSTGLAFLQEFRLPKQYGHLETD